MSESIFIEWFEIPFRIYADKQKAEPQTWTYPGCDESWEVTKIEVAADELEGLPQPRPCHIDVTMQEVIAYIWNKYSETLQEAASEHE